MQHIEPNDAVFFRESQLIFLTCSAIKLSPDTLQFRGEITEWPEIHNALFYEATKKKKDHHQQQPQRSNREKA